MTGVMDLIPEITLNNCHLIQGLAQAALDIGQIASNEKHGVVDAYCERHPDLGNLLRTIEHFRQELRKQEKADA